MYKTFYSRCTSYNVRKLYYVQDFLQQMNFPQREKVILQANENCESCNMKNTLVSVQDTKTLSCVKRRTQLHIIGVIKLVTM